jgi:putative transposase
VFSKEVEKTLKEVCLGIKERFEINFIEIGADDNHVHFLLQSIPTMTVKRIVQVIKSITAREIFERHKEVKKRLWGGQFWTSGYYANTVGHYGNEELIKKYIEGQGGHHRKVYRGQIELFEGI